MGEKSRRQEQRGERRGSSSSMSEEDRAAFRAAREQRLQDSSDEPLLDLEAGENGDGPKLDGHSMKIADFRTLSKEERQKHRHADT